MRKISRILRCDYSAEELDEKRDELANATIEIGRVEEQKASVNRQFKEKLDGLYSETAELAAQIKERHELRATECIVDLNKPNVGEKTIIRTDTGEMVAIEVMTMEERQEELPLEIVPAEPPKESRTTADKELQPAGDSVWSVNQSRRR